MPTSKSALLVLYTPTHTKNSADGNRYLYGTFNRRAHMPISGRFMTTSSTLPIQKLAIRPQNRSACSVTICGPGCMPWMISAPSISAMTESPGIPRLMVGMKLVCAAELFAASGPAIPSMAPLPKRCGVLDTRFSMA